MKVLLQSCVSFLNYISLHSRGYQQDFFRRMSSIQNAVDIDTLIKLVQVYFPNGIFLAKLEYLKKTLLATKPQFYTSTKTLCSFTLKIISILNNGLIEKHEVSLMCSAALEAIHSMYGLQSNPDKIYIALSKIFQAGLLWVKDSQKFNLKVCHIFSKFFSQLITHAEAVLNIQIRNVIHFQNAIKLLLEAITDKEMAIAGQSGFIDILIKNDILSLKVVLECPKLFQIMQYYSVAGSSPDSIQLFSCNALQQESCSLESIKNYDVEIASTPEHSNCSKYESQIKKVSVFDLYRFIINENYSKSLSMLKTSTIDMSDDTTQGFLSYDYCMLYLLVSKQLKNKEYNVEGVLERLCALLNKPDLIPEPIQSLINQYINTGAKMWAFREKISIFHQNPDRESSNNISSAIDDILDEEISFEVFKSYLYTHNYSTLDVSPSYIAKFEEVFDKLYSVSKNDNHNPKLAEKLAKANLMALNFVYYAKIQSKRVSKMISVCLMGLSSRLHKSEKYPQINCIVESVCVLITCLYGFENPLKLGHALQIDPPQFLRYFFKILVKDFFMLSSLNLLKTLILCINQSDKNSNMSALLVMIFCNIAKLSNIKKYIINSNENLFTKHLLQDKLVSQDQAIVFLIYI